MYKGKHKCETLKVIRKQIADVNKIPYEPVVCNLFLLSYKFG